MERKSKSQLKREMLALQSLGERLVSLKPEQLQRIRMPEELREAVLFAAKLKKGEALRRQLQYIGTLMRDADPEPIREALEEIGRGRTLDIRRFRRIERWRDDLVNGSDEPLQEIARDFPGADLDRLRRWVLEARRERAAGCPPKSARALFRFLRTLLEPKPLQ